MSNKATQFKKGESGNPNGAPKKAESLTGLMREFLRNIPEGQKQTYKDIFIQKVYKQALNGDTACIRLIWNYLDGMPEQRMQLGNDGQPFQITINS